ncbi:MAG: sigma-70 family RNA polymerase sigma factor [Deltaproteobacteria bacterium]|nr:MAG: sigma-70 family RNA polymerase sigma factor [Deltaproteobacteria bacterium]
MDSNLLKDYMKVIYNRCYRLLRDKDLAWDAMQEVLARYYERASKETIQKPLNYLYRISTTHCLHTLKQKDRSLPLEPEQHEKITEPTQHRGENKLLLSKLQERFDDDEIQMLLYRHVDQMNYQEIAEIIQMSDRGVKKKLDRLEETVRKYLSR